MYVLNEDMVLPINAKIKDVRAVFDRLRNSKLWLKNESKLKNGRECHTFTLQGENISHTFYIADKEQRVLHVFQAEGMLTAECARFVPKAK